MDLTLDEIILDEKNASMRKYGRKTSNRKPQHVDARSIIIERRRSEMRDALGRLVEMRRARGNARQHLVAPERPIRVPPTASIVCGRSPTERSSYRTPSFVRRPRVFNDHDNMDHLEQKYVDNMLLSGPPLIDLTNDADSPERYFDAVDAHKLSSSTCGECSMPPKLSAPPTPPPIPESSNFRIIVSNLPKDVIQSEIRELFDDIDGLLDAHILRPGVAEVIYNSLAHAVNAVNMYHDRLLDNLLMKCLLVYPRASNKPTAPSQKTEHELQRAAE